MNMEKKLIQLFRVFVEKALIPQVKKFDGSVVEWSKFSNMISCESVNYNELQIYVDSLPSSIPSVSSYDKQSIQNKKKQQNSEFEFGFNPNKTFGGERNKINMIPYSEEPQRRESTREDSIKNKVALLNGNTLNSLEKLLKGLEENQQVIENLMKENTTQRNNKSDSTGKYVQNAPYQQSYHKGYH